MNGKKVLLIIMDGWGLGQVPSSDAIQHAKVPFVTSLLKNYPNTTLVTYGELVGLPDGQMGNSEVGHLNIGAGRIVYQELQRINVAVRSGELTRNPVFCQALEYAKLNQKPLHLLGISQ
jgi:2,3-bisphosphoglycerate-independent phosphoglycerate mutase